MHRASPYAIAFLLATLALGGCSGFHVEVVKPPRFAKDAEPWWAETLDRLDPDFVAALCEVSAMHRRQGTTATYVRFYLAGWTMAGPYCYEHRLPVPLPEKVVAAAIARLVHGKPAGKPYQDLSPKADWRWEGGKGCSEQQAEHLWQEARKRVGCTIREKTQP